MTKTTTPKAIIAGAGPAGLTAAWELRHRTDVETEVYEATDAIGGIAQTVNYKNNRIDIGGHRFFTKSERVLDWWLNIIPVQGAPASDGQDRELQVSYPQTATVVEAGAKAQEIPSPHPQKEDRVMLQRRRISRIFFRRSFFDYPLSLKPKLALQLGPINSVQIGVSYLKSRFFPIKDETFLENFFINRFGKRLYKTFFKEYTEKVWGVGCHEIRADWGAQRIKGLSLKGALIQAAKDMIMTEEEKANRKRETSLTNHFFYPKYGPGQMWEEVTRQVKNADGSVIMKHKVVGVQMEEKRVKSVTIENVEDGSTKEHPCDYFFSTMPMKNLFEMMTPAPPPEVLKVSRGLQYRDFLTVGLLLNKLHVLEKYQQPKTEVPDNWIYVQDTGVYVGRVQIFNNWSPYMVADNENTVWIGLEYFVDEGDHLWNMKDEDLIALGIKEAQKIGFIKSDDYLDGCAIRMPKAYPAYFGTYEQIPVLQEYVTQIENLYLIGRNGMHRYNNQDHSMLVAMQAVDGIVEGVDNRKELWSVNTEQEYHEEK
jgi:protoporphyrinogen oxidase